MEVIYTGLRQTPEMIAAAALQEDVDAVGVSILSGAHNTLCPRIVQLLREKGMNDCLVLVGGIVPQEDLPRLKEQGVAEVFLPGTSTEDIVTFLLKNVKPANERLANLEEISGEIAIIRFTNPADRNPLSLETLNRLAAFLERAQKRTNPPCSHFNWD